MATKAEAAGDGADPAGGGADPAGEDAVPGDVAEAPCISTIKHAN